MVVVNIQPQIRPAAAGKTVADIQHPTITHRNPPITTQ
jgi:hypothetical protein